MNMKFRVLITVTTCVVLFTCTHVTLCKPEYLNYVLDRFKRQPEVAAKQSSRACTLPFRHQFSIDYTVNCYQSKFENTPCRETTEGALVPEFTTLKLSCQAGYMLDTDEEIVCFKKKWNPSISTCKKLCQNLEFKNTHTKFACYRGFERINCRGSLVDGVRVTVECTPGYRLKNSTEVQEVFCGEDGKWTADLEECVPRMCRKISLSVTNLDCYRDGEKQDCNKPLLAGTNIHPYCPPDYQPNHKEALCNDHGEWDYNEVECTPECGKSSKINTKYKKTVRPADYREFPWNAAVYYTDIEMSVMFPATIITPYLIITDAREIMTKNGTVHNEFEVIVAKRTRNPEVFDDDMQKTYKVRDIYINGRLAILELTEKIILSAAVYPVCVNWKESELLNAKYNTLGQVPNWYIGYENGTDVPTDILQTFTLAFRTANQCRSDVNKDFMGYVNNDTFCGEPVPVVSPVHGGSAFIYREKNTNLFYIQGTLCDVWLLKQQQPPVTSRGFRIAFTNLVAHMNWINSIRKRNENSLFLKELVFDSQIEPE